MLKFALGLFFGTTFSDLLNTVLEFVKSALNVHTMKFNVKINNYAKEMEKQELPPKNAIGFRN